MSGLSFELRANGAKALIASTSAASTVATSPSFNNQLKCHQNQSEIGRNQCKMGQNQSKTGIISPK